MSSKSIDVIFESDKQEGSESYLSQWLKNIGNVVTKNEALIEVSTDKVNIEIAAPATGVLQEILKNPNDRIMPGEVLGRIAVAAKAQAPIATATAQRTESADKGCGITGSAVTPASELSPAVKRLLKEHNLSAEQITGSGKEGRISVADVELFLSSRSADGAPGKENVITLSPMRKSIAHHMVESLLQNVPHVTTVFEVDYSNVFADRMSRKKSAGAQSVSLSAYIIKAMALAAARVPEANARFENDRVILYPQINVGVATAVESNQPMQAGLFVPVIKNCADLSITQISGLLDALTEKAKAGSLSKEDLEGCTISLSNYGMSGGLLAAPIVIPRGQSAIVGAGKIEKRAVVSTTGDSDKIEARPMGYITLSLDHRVLDGFRANLFLSVMKDVLEACRMN